MDPLHPILPHRSDPAPVGAPTRAARSDRDGRGGSGHGGDGRRRTRRDDQDAVEVDVQGLHADGGPAALGEGEDLHSHIDLTA